MSYFGALIPLLILIVWLISAIRLASRGHLICGMLMGVGILGFFGPVLLPLSGTWLNHIELPPFHETTSIVGPGDRTFTATISLARVQRYDGNGQFETGWFVDNAGGHFAIGLTVDGRIAIASARTKRVEFFNPDGSSAGSPQPCAGSDGSNRSLLLPSNCRVQGVTFLEPSQAKSPPAHWTTLLLFPLWHPSIAWLLGALGLVGGAIYGRQ
jgi:hypothetical protein